MTINDVTGERVYHVIMYDIFLSISGSQFRVRSSYIKTKNNPKTFTKKPRFSSFTGYPQAKLKLVAEIMSFILKIMISHFHPPPQKTTCFVNIRNLNE